MAHKARRHSKEKKRPSARKPSRAAKRAKAKPSRKAVRKRLPHVKSWPKSMVKLRPKSAQKTKKAAEAPARKEAPPKPNTELLTLLGDARIRQLLVDAGGEHTLEIVKSFSKELSDDDLAKKLKIKISDVRATLNRLHNIGVVQYNRYKDAETGWFSYFWSLNMDKTKGWVEEQLMKDSAPGDISSSEYYFCPKCGSESIYEFAAASDYSFRCPLCNRALEFVDEDAAKDLFPRGPRRPSTP
ncbi:MAG: hypothetical protein AB1657_04475 [Candidatus Micrarchaeota archaeon]